MDKSDQALRKRKNEYRREYYRKNKKRHYENGKRWVKNNREAAMIINARSRAKKANLEFSITKEDIVIPEICPLLEVPIELAGDRDTCPTIDRKDSTLGYTKDNIWIISGKANRIKNNGTKEEILTLAKNVNRLL